MKLKDRILYELIRSVQKNGSEVVIPNIYFGSFEFDLFRMLPNGYIYEYEVKTSRQDFRNDFEKKKEINKDGEFVSVSKHKEIQSGKYVANKFYFVVPNKLIKPEELPKGIGLIYYIEEGQKKFLKLIKLAGFINKNKIEVNSLELIKKLSYRELELRKKLYRYESRRINSSCNEERRQNRSYKHKAKRTEENS